MKQKLLSMVILAAMVFALGVGLPASATKTDENVVYSYGFDTGSEGYRGNGAAYGPNLEDEIPDTEPHSGEYYLSLPNNNSYYTIYFTPPEGGDDANYILSFYAKTSLGQSICVETVPQVIKDTGAVSWATYRKENGLPCISDAEGKSYSSTGIATADGGEWVKNSVEFRVPEGCDRMNIYIGAYFISSYMNTTYASYVSQADPYRAIDSITIAKADFNYFRNGNFECIAYKADGTVQMPYSTWEAYGARAALMKDGDNQYMYTADSTANSTCEGYIAQNVYLYQGEYLLSMDVSMTSGDDTPTRGAQIVSFDKGTVAATNAAATAADCNLLGGQRLALIDPDKTTERTRSYSTYFTVNAAGTYYFRAGNGYYTGEFIYDNIKIVPVEYANLQFGTVTHSATDTKAAEEGGGDFHFEYIPANNLEAGDTVKAFGYGVTAAAGDAAQIITAVYKISESGQRVLAELKIDNAEAGKLFAGTDITIPTTEAGESLEIKAMVLDSVAGLKPLGDTFILE